MCIYIYIYICISMYIYIYAKHHLITPLNLGGKQVLLQTEDENHNFDPHPHYRARCMKYC